MRSLSRRFLYRVIAPEGEILYFAQPLESIQRKGGSIAASSCPPTAARHPCAHSLCLLLYAFSMCVIPAWTVGMTTTGMYKDYHPWRWIPVSWPV